MAACQRSMKWDGSPAAAGSSWSRPKITTSPIMQAWRRSGASIRSTARDAKEAIVPAILTSHFLLPVTENGFSEAELPLLPVYPQETACTEQGTVSHIANSSSGRSQQWTCHERIQSDPRSPENPRLGRGERRQAR